MKFLCLPGAYGSAKNFKVQLGPLADELQARGVATFEYSQGSHEVEPPEGWEDYFGTRPLYRFLDTRRGDTFESLRRLRHMPYSVNAEDAMRMFQDCGEGDDWHQQVWREALDDVQKTIDEHPDVEALIGYSEGAMVGASFIVDEATKAQKTGREPRIKFAIFISGSPPLKLEGDNRVVAQLADEAGTVIDIPTFHIFGCDDAFLGGAVALYNNVRMLADILAKLIPDVEARYKEKKEKADEEPKFYYPGRRDTVTWAKPGKIVLEKE
ncbi:serine hydrolase-domain-containing protein [Staphylotrichum tortipilum]|uniref:Serine hydrolase-domain-containing protein n=1 Tax=Staphylotrichum tortipilum TaxID=2831512 RepID=A0AAN6RTF0_9PEZI|nr:serine hydrolase-domain-containing protein [Staphylotrichum longicolle]